MRGCWGLAVGSGRSLSWEARSRASIIELLYDVGSYLVMSYLSLCRPQAARRGAASVGRALQGSLASKEGR